MPQPTVRQFQELNVAEGYTITRTHHGAQKIIIVDLETASVLDERATIMYNSLGFDLPILQRRSLYLNVQAPILNLDKYRSPHLDLLQQRMSLNGTKPYRKLSWYAKRFGLDVPADETSGKDIGAMVTAGDWAGIAAHCSCDVRLTRALAVLMGYVAK